MRRLGSKLDAIEGTAESLPLMASTGSLHSGKSTTGKLQEGGEGEDTDCRDKDFDDDSSILQVRERVDSLTFNRFYVIY
jgi:hypothetical protein